MQRNIVLEPPLSKLTCGSAQTYKTPNCTWPCGRRFRFLYLMLQGETKPSEPQPTARNWLWCYFRKRSHSLSVFFLLLLSLPPPHFEKIIISVFENCNAKMWPKVSLSGDVHSTIETATNSFSGYDRREKLRSVTGSRVFSQWHETDMAGNTLHQSFFRVHESYLLSQSRW